MRQYLKELVVTQRFELWTKAIQRSKRQTLKSLVTSRNGPKINQSATLDTTQRPHMASFRFTLLHATQ